MEEQLDDSLAIIPVIVDPGLSAVVITGPDAADQQSPIDPLRRIWVPRETKTSKGTIVFRTLDGDVYARLADGSIRRAIPKVNGKEARRARQRVRRGAVRGV